MHRISILSTFALCAFVPAATAQQFVYQPGTLPGTTRWTEGVELADVDNDGDIDIFFGEGEGFNSPGAQRQNILIINQQVEVAPGMFSDESVPRLGTNLSHCKGVAAGDVNGDGWIDALFANAFNTDTPFLYINRGAAQPGFFDMESATRGFTENLNSAGAQFGDLDDDGDLDVIINDSGNSFLSNPGDRPRLFFNDGGGNFTEDAAALNAVVKRAQMDVQLADIDNDWDLDFIGFTRANNAGGAHYLMLNDGDGNFTDMSSLITSNSGGTYEGEVGDLDGDNDLDFFLVSISGFNEGAITNNITPSGSLSFTNGPGIGPGVDDNEICLFDYDNDGDLDSFVGSLGSTERVYRNTAGSFALVGSVFSTVGDPTLDMAVGDLDGDGDYDVVTANGEGNSSQWGNKYYENTGAPDNLAPLVTATRIPAMPTEWPVVTHAKMRDQLIDDGVTFVTGRAAYVAVDPMPSNVDFSGGQFTPALLNVSVGTRVIFTNQDGGVETVTSDTAPYDFNLNLTGSGSTAEYIFVSPGTYNYSSFLSGASGTIVVGGSVDEVEGVLSGGSIYRFALPQIAQGASTELAVEFFFEDGPGNEGVSMSETMPFPAPSCGEFNFCTAAPNSVAAGAWIQSNGNYSIAANAFELQSGPIAAGEPGVFFYGNNMVNGGNGLPFGDGFRCVGGTVFRLPVGFTNAMGGLVYTLDFNGPNGMGGAVTSGATWLFQSWYRDPAAMGSSFNLSNGLSVTFCP